MALATLSIGPRRELLPALKLQDERPYVSNLLEGRIEETRPTMEPKLTISTTVRFLDLVKPFTPLIPEIAIPETKTPFQQRLIWTGVTLLIFLVMSQMPLYGIVSSGKMRSIAVRVGGQHC